MPRFLDSLPAPDLTSLLPPGVHVQDKCKFLTTLLNSRPDKSLTTEDGAKITLLEPDKHIGVIDQESGDEKLFSRLLIEHYPKSGDSVADEMPFSSFVIPIGMGAEDIRTLITKRIGKTVMRDPLSAPASDDGLMFGTSNPLQVIGMSVFINDYKSRLPGSSQ